MKREVEDDKEEEERRKRGGKTIKREFDEDGREDKEKEQVGIVATERFRKLAPAHFLFKIQSFSLLSNNGVDKYESNEFEVDGYKWKLLVYPDGNKSQNGTNHISLYLVIANGSSLNVGWEAEVVLRLFLFDQIRDRYLVRGDMEGGTSRFHEMKTEQGFSQFLSLAKFHDQANGYLMEDTCIFGAEVFLYKRFNNRGCLSMVKIPILDKHIWKIGNFSKIKEEKLYSNVFKAGGQSWNIDFYAKGDIAAKDKYVSIYLNLRSCQETPSLRVYADFVLRLKDQIHGLHCQNSTVKCWFGISSKSWGWSKFIDLGIMNDMKNGFLVKDTCIVEVELKVLGVAS